VAEGHDALLKIPSRSTIYSTKVFQCLVYVQVSLIKRCICHVPYISARLVLVIDELNPLNMNIVKKAWFVASLAQTPVKPGLMVLSPKTPRVRLETRQE
jgi:hypothetical protein